MRYASAIAAILVALPVQAADLGKPATLADIQSLPPPSLARCYAETSVTGTFLRTDRVASYGIGGGCDATLANLVIGGGLRGDWTDGAGIAVGSVFAKLGIAINNGATLYGLAEWKVPDWKIKDAGQLALGAGGELSLSIINPNLSLFAEGTVGAAKFGATATKDDVNTRLGLRYRW